MNHQAGSSRNVNSKPLQSSILRATARHQDTDGVLLFDLCTSDLCWMIPNQHPSNPSILHKALEIKQLETKIKRLYQEEECSLVILLRPDHKVKQKSQDGSQDPHQIRFYFTADGQQAEKDRQNFISALRVLLGTRSHFETPTSSLLTAPSSGVIIQPSEHQNASSIPQFGSFSSNFEGIPPKESDYHKLLLKANPSVFELHKDSVSTDIISRSAFWSHSQIAKLLAEVKHDSNQRIGRSRRIVDPQTEIEPDGQELRVLDDEIIGNLFEEFPVIKRAFDEQVPKNIDQNPFWQRFFGSRLYAQLISFRPPTQNTSFAQEDDILDKYLEGDDDDLEPRAFLDSENTLLDLNSTAQDHPRLTYEDWLTKPDRRALSLMRSLNKHSCFLLGSEAFESQSENQSKGSSSELNSSDPKIARSSPITSKRQRLQKSIIVTDLEEKSHRRAIPLEVTKADRKIYDESEIDRSRSVDSSSSKNGDGSMAMMRMLGNIKGRLKVKTELENQADLEPSIEKSLALHHRTAIGLLRQFWSISAPQPDSFSIQEGDEWIAIDDLSRQTKDIKTTRLKESLRSWAEEETEKLIQEAEKRGEREARVEILKALSETLKAVRIAIGKNRQNVPL